MNAAYFRRQAARARVMARNGDDLLVAGMLLRLADDMEAEADILEAEASSASAAPPSPAAAPGQPHAATP